MSILDKVVAAVTPTETEEQRLNARVKARSAAMDGDWLSLVLLHHQQIESAFEGVKAATDAASRVAAQKRLAKRTRRGIRPRPTRSSPRRRCA